MGTLNVRSSAIAAAGVLSKLGLLCAAHLPLDPQRLKLVSENLLAVMFQ